MKYLSLAANISGHGSQIENVLLVQPPIFFCRSDVYDWQKDKLLQNVCCITVFFIF